jgi:hypothetical protein
MMTPQAEVLKSLEDLLFKRLDLLKLYPVLSAQAMQCLEKSDAEGLNEKLNERGLLTEKIDAVGAQIDTLVSRLDKDSGAIVISLMKPGAPNNDCPVWGVNIARSVERTYKLLQSCALFDEKLLSSAKALHMENQSQLCRIRAQRKINTAYYDQNATPNGSHIHFSSK